MSKELLLQQKQINPLQNENDIEDKEEKIIQDIELEIECPRCYDIMALSYDSNINDGLCYFCQECNMSLLID
jgi:predicted nuclease of restriction endonuclease-like (RecB) superfamily